MIDGYVLLKRRAQEGNKQYKMLTNLSFGMTFLLLPSTALNR